MTDKLIAALAHEYTLVPLDIGEFSMLKVNGMKFTLKTYHAEGLGHVSVMRAKGFFGLMQMDTVMVVPFERDLPLYSYDRIHAMGNDTLIIELYDTVTEPLDLAELDGVKEKFSHLPDRDPGEHWYDSIKLPQSVSKKGKKAIMQEFDALTLAHFDAYVFAPAGKVTDRAKKKALSTAYVDGLLKHGGPSTDIFKKELGIETTERLFRTVLFGTALDREA